MRILITLTLLLAINCKADWAFVVGTNVQFTASAIPSTGRIQSTQQVVLGLQGADAALQRSCGWYPMVDATVTPEGMRIASSMWRVEETAVVRICTYAAIPPRNLTVSKYKLLTNIDAAGYFNQFEAWLNALPSKERMLWSAATSLDSTNALVQAAIASMPALFNIPASSVSNLITRSQSDAQDNR